MKKYFILLFIVTLFAGCSAKEKGWPQSERDKLINSCIKKAKEGAPQFNQEGLKKYCTCYQENIEKKYPVVKELKKITPNEISQAAQSCVQLLVN